MKLLYVTSLSGKRINGFMRSAILAAHNVRLDFCMACNMEGADKIGYAQDCFEYGINVKHIPFERNPLSIKNKTAYDQLLQYMQEKQFDIVHCNTPIGGILGRLCAKRTGSTWISLLEGCSTEKLVVILPSGENVGSLHRCSDYN